MSEQWDGPVPVQGLEVAGAPVLWLCHDQAGELLAGGGYLVVWQDGVTEWASGELLYAAGAEDFWALPAEDAFQFGWALVRLAGRADSYSPDELDAGSWRPDWCGPDPIEYTHYPLSTDSLVWEDQRQGLLTPWLFYDGAGDLVGEREFFIACSPGVEVWDNGQILDTHGETLILALPEAVAFGHTLAALGERGGGAP